MSKSFSTTDSASELPLNPRPPSERATKLRLLILVLLILGIAAMLFWRASPDDRAIEATLRTVVDTIKEKQNSAEAKALAMSKGHAFEFGSAASPEDLDRRIALVAEAEKDNEDLLTYGNAAGDKIKAELKAHNVPDAKIDEAVNAFEKQVWSNRRKMFAESGRMYSAGRELLTLLRQNWGHWKYDAAEKKFDTETDALAQSIGDKQLALQRAIISQRAASQW